MGAECHNGLITEFIKAPFESFQGHVAVKCTATIYSEYFESSEYYLPGLGLGEKALESYSRGTNGELPRKESYFGHR